MTPMKLTAGIWLALAALLSAGSLEFPKASQEVEATADAMSLTADFEFTNKTDKAVTISKTDPGCSCVSVQIGEGKLRYEPGETGTIRAKFDLTNLSGTADKTILLWLDNDPADQPSTKLNLKIKIPVLIALEPKTLKWDLDGKGEAQTIHIKMSAGQTIHIGEVTSSSENFVLDLKTLEDGKNYDLVVTPKDVKSSALGVFRIETDCNIKKHRTQQAFGVIRKPTAAEQAAKP